MRSYFETPKQEILDLIRHYQHYGYHNSEDRNEKAFDIRHLGEEAFQLINPLSWIPAVIGLAGKGLFGERHASRIKPFRAIYRLLEKAEDVLSKDKSSYEMGKIIGDFKKEKDKILSCSRDFGSPAYKMNDAKPTSYEVNQQLEKLLNKLEETLTVCQLKHCHILETDDAKSIPLSQLNLKG